MNNRALVWAIAIFLFASFSRAADEAPAGLPTGTYRVWQNQAIIHYMELLPNGTYRVSDRMGEKPKSEGTYMWDKETGVVTWKSGLHAEKQYTGDFRTDHVIRLNLTFYGYNVQDKYAPSDNSKPRAGTYTVHRGLFRITLDGNGKYSVVEFNGQSRGEGAYEYDAKEKMIKWSSGPNLDKGYRGTFSFDQKIVMSKDVYAEYLPK